MFFCVAIWWAYFEDFFQKKQHNLHEERENNI